MLEAVFSHPPTTLAFALAPVGVIIVYLLYQTFFSPLAGVPGPFAARFSRLWLAYHGWKGDFHTLLTRLHEEYGDVVRIGPNEVATTAPDAVKKIYGAADLAWSEFKWHDTNLYYNVIRRRIPVP